MKIHTIFLFFLITLFFSKPTLIASTEPNTTTKFSLFKNKTKRSKKKFSKKHYNRLNRRKKVSLIKKNKTSLTKNSLKNSNLLNQFIEKEILKKIEIIEANQVFNETQKELFNIIKKNLSINNYAEAITLLTELKSSLNKEEDKKLIEEIINAIQNLLNEKKSEKSEDSKAISNEIDSNTVDTKIIKENNQQNNNEEKTIQENIEKNILLPSNSEKNTEQKPAVPISSQIIKTVTETNSTQNQSNDTNKVDINNENNNTPKRELTEKEKLQKTLKRLEEEKVKEEIRKFNKEQDRINNVEQEKKERAIKEEARKQEKRDKKEKNEEEKKITDKALTKSMQIEQKKYQAQFKNLIQEEIDAIRKKFEEYEKNNKKDENFQTTEKWKKEIIKEYENLKSNINDSINTLITNFNYTEKINQISPGKLKNYLFQEIEHKIIVIKNKYRNKTNQAKVDESISKALNLENRQTAYYNSNISYEEPDSSISLIDFEKEPDNDKKKYSKDDLLDLKKNQINSIRNKIIEAPKEKGLLQRGLDYILSYNKENTEKKLNNTSVDNNKKNNFKEINIKIKDITLKLNEILKTGNNALKNNERKELEKINSEISEINNQIKIIKKVSFENPMQQEYFIEQLQKLLPLEKKIAELNQNLNQSFPEEEGNSTFPEFQQQPK